jgi:hypothetical protein
VVLTLHLLPAIVYIALQIQTFSKGKIMNSESREMLGDCYPPFAPLLRKVNQRLAWLEEEIRLINALPLPERLLAWSEWNRMCRPPLTTALRQPVDPHADT